MAEIDTSTLSTGTETNRDALPIYDAADPYSGVMEFAQNAVGAQVGRVSEVLNSTADSIDEFVGSSSSPLPEGARGFVTSTSSKLRDLAGRMTEQEAHKLLESLQETARNHPAATAGLGATLGALLGLAVAKLGNSTAVGKPVRKSSSETSQA